MVRNTGKIILWAALLSFPVFFLGSCQQQKTTPQPQSDMEVIEDEPAVTVEEPTDDTPFARVDFSDRDLNIGKMHKGDVRTFDIHYTNTGTLPVTIDNIDTGCSCTKVDYTSVILQPGETSVLHFTFDAHDELMFGDKERYITISLVETVNLAATEDYITFRYEIIPDSQPIN